MVLGSHPNATYHVYVANYASKDDVFDVCSTQVALTDLDSAEAMVRFSGGCGGVEPLNAAWGHLHGNDSRSVTSLRQLDERVFEPYGYSANAVFGRHFTTIHATPQASSSFVSIETSLPLTLVSKEEFVKGCQEMCPADSFTLTEFVISPTLFQGNAPLKIPGFEVLQSSQSVGRNFASAVHYYRRAPFGGDENLLVTPCASPPSSFASLSSFDPENASCDRKHGNET